MGNPTKPLKSLQDVKKVGFITPSSNTALEPMTMAMSHQISSRISTHFSRVPVKTLTLDSKDVNQFQTQKMVDSAALLSDGRMDAILWNGTSGSWTGKGFEADISLCEEISGVTGVPASTSSLAQLDVLKHYGIKRFALAVPYVEEPTRKIIETYGNQGFTVVNAARLDQTENVVIGNTPFERIKQLLRDADAPDAECLVVACTNLPATAVVDEMEAELGKPIFDSIAVTLWKALKMTSIDVPLHGFGKLLRANPVLEELERVMATLREVTGGSRTTLRIDIPEHNCNVDRVCAESVAPGIPELKLNTSLNQRSLATVQWLIATRKPLVQDDCANAEVKPPKALMEVYGVKAQMLVGLEAADGEVIGWISVHYVPGTRQWTDAEVAALQNAAGQVRTILQRTGWASFK
ncbi:GAF domain-containing protein [Paraburkholderia sp. DGU8]|uniref:aspartate racemase/maleate isomerase family protein n=1 Tax=Paraburkholderia sp. DGU8 TaxID=3161997 RepID=UPI0034662D70